VTNLENGLVVDVKINDRGPYVGDRVIDLSRRAAQELEMMKPGVVPVKVEELPAAPMQSASSARDTTRKMN
jgi:rare lipoprotein A